VEYMMGKDRLKPMPGLRPEPLPPIPTTPPRSLRRMLQNLEADDPGVVPR
jgi:hypothetical protein